MLNGFMNRQDVHPTKKVLLRGFPWLQAGLAAALRPRKPIDVKTAGPLAKLASRLNPMTRTLVRVVIANLEMGGVLLDGLTRWRRLVLLSIVMGVLVDYFARPYITIDASIILAVVLFVARQGFLLGSFVPNGVADRLKVRLGEEQGGHAYEAITALFFYHRSYSYSLLVQKTAFLDAGWLMPYTVYLQLVGWLFIGVGLFVNTWAFLSIGRPAYYYLDMYYGRFLQPFSTSGLYRLLKNPMYSVGQLPGYGLALMYGSWLGLVFAVANHAFCYVFYYVAEHPHVRAVLRSKQGVVAL